MVKTRDKHSDHDRWSEVSFVHHLLCLHGTLNQV